MGQRFSMDALSAYIPMDRRLALAEGRGLPDRVQGAALFADISGFTPLTEALVRELGPQRGAEELTLTLNRVYDALISELHAYGGSVIGFSGDAITCWLDRDTGLRATACALAMQQSMQRLSAIVTPSGTRFTLAMKAAVAAGRVRRFLVGDPDIQVFDVLAGAILDQLSAAEHQALKGEVVLAPDTARLLNGQVGCKEFRPDPDTGQLFAVVEKLLAPVPLRPWLPLPQHSLTLKDLEPWLLPPVYERLQSGLGEFLAEFRPVVTLFLRFGGIDYDRDEQAGARLDAYIRWVQSVLAGYEGYLVQLTIGDKGSYLCAAFGAPVAHEDDPLRAVSAAWTLREPPAGLDFIDSIHIGIAQGQMRTGAYGAAAQRTYGIMGDEINLSARLMQAAAGGQVLASLPTGLSTAEAFNWELLPDLQVKGKSEPVPVRSLSGPKQRPKAHLQAPRYSLPMVGRQAEIGRIREKLSLALGGRGQIIAVTGEAGMGKSRLIAELVSQVDEKQIDCLIGECESFGTNASYLVWQNIWRGFFELDPALPAEEQLRKLEARLTSLSPDLLPRLPLLGIAVNLPIPDNDLTRSFDAKLRKVSTENLLADCLRARAREKPLLLVLEDCQWIDPLSDDLLEGIGRVIADLPVLLLIAYRPLGLPDLRPPRVSRLPHFTEIALADFAPQEAERLIRLKLEQFSDPQAQIDSALVERVISRAEGNPFYIEELLNYLHDQQNRGLDPQDRQSLEQLDLPTSLHSLILSRIDQLSESQVLTLKVASVIGRLFKAAVLWGAYPQIGEQRQVISDLEALRRIDIMELEAAEPELSYLFKHVITQEVTYESLPYATRALLHEQIGMYIERAFAHSPDQSIDLLAFHFERSDNLEKKREYLLKAGQAAQANYANATATGYYERLIPLLPLSEQPSVMLKLGQVLELVGQWGEAGDLYQQALELVDRSEDRQAQAWCRAAIGELLRKQGRYAEAKTWLDQAQTVFELVGDLAGVGQTLHNAGTLAAQQGDFDNARRLYEKSLGIRRRLDDRPRIASLLSNLGILARFQGDTDLARSLHEEGLAIRRKLGDKWAIANSLNNLGNVALDENRYDEARSRLEEALSLLRQVGDRWAIANALNNLGNAARTQGDFSSARRLYRESLDIYLEFDDKRALAYLLEDMGGLAAIQGQPERALILASGAESLRQAIGSPLSPAEQVKLDALLEPAHEQLDPISVSLALSQGRSMGLEEILAYAVEEGEGRQVGR